jgi:hypothetical protein
MGKIATWFHAELVAILPATRHLAMTGTMFVLPGDFYWHLVAGEQRCS